MYHYYSEHSQFTHPGLFSSEFNKLPDSLTDLIQIVQGLVIHRVDGQLFGYNIPNERLSEMEIRTVSQMLSTLFKINSDPLTRPRATHEKLISSCRNFALLLCAFLRHKGIPARIRIGFAHYLFGGTQDHVVTEYWDDTAKKWRLVDSRLNPEYITKLPRSQHIDILNITQPDFYLAGEIWKNCRKSNDDPNKYGYGLIRSIRGMRHIQDRLIQDLAALNKIEMLPWDLWGYMILDLPGIAPHEPEHLATIDNIAVATTNASTPIETIKNLYQHPKLQLSNPILCASTVLGKHELTIERALQ